MFLNIVSDEALLTSQVVKSILFVLVVVGIAYNLYRIIKAESQKRRLINSVIFVLLLIVIVIVYKEFRLEAELLNHPKYVSGTTVGYCSVFARGEGIKFEYELNGKKYCNCNTFHPISRDSILIPGGKYFVRFSDKFPEEGRMDFTRKVE